MNRKVALVVLCLLFVGCVPVTPPEPDYHVIETGTLHPDVIYIGDSLCYSSIDNDVNGEIVYAVGPTAMEQAGIGRDCKSGRTAAEYPDQLPLDARVIFWALVTNSVNETPIDEFRADLQAKLASTDAIVYCVLPIPIVKGHDSTAYANVMREECTNVIDKMDYLVSPFALDGYHETAQQHNEFVPALTSRI